MISRCLALLAIASWCIVPSAASALDRGEVAKQLKSQSVARRQTAEAIAKVSGWRSSGVTTAGTRYQLVEVYRGIPLYYQPLTQNAVITIAGDLVRNTPPYNLNGSGATVAVWDDGLARLTHEALTPRVSSGDGWPIYSHHATAMCGLIGASGAFNSYYEGMAPSVSILSYEFFDDAAEMMAVGASSSGQPAAVHVSNHSYGILSGWEFGDYSGNVGYHFFGDWAVSPPPESSMFGLYVDRAVLWDQICHDLPYFLPVIAAGNDRDDVAPPASTPFYRIDSSGPTPVWVLVGSYMPGTDPPADSTANGGFDTIQPLAAGKNTLCIGAVNDGVSAGTRSISAASMSGFSGWGPLDDGRIKPDLVANGVGVLLIAAVSDGFYSVNPANGTSFSVPCVVGGAALLQQYEATLFPGQALRASTMKALLIHTADDLTAGAARPGPDYSTGWGLVNIEAAADVIKAQAELPANRYIIEDNLDSANPTRTYFFSSGGADPIRVTLCWTDPPAAERTALDDRTPVLVNDLDLRLLGPGGTPVYTPFVLDVQNPADTATTGDNAVDNVEQVLLATPAAGSHSIVISHKAALTGGLQTFSLILTGLEGDGSAGVGDWLRMTDHLDR